MPAEAPKKSLGPSVIVEFPAYVYGQNFTSLDKIDFENFRYRLDKNEPLVRLRKGRYEHTEKDQGGNYLWYEREALERVWRIPADRPSALVMLDSFSAGGSSSDDAVLQLFQLGTDGKLVLVQQLTFDRQADGTGVAFNTVTHELTITARSDDGSAHCCPEHVDVVKYRWGGGRFVQTSASRKTLPKE